jgi:PhnB protein
MQINPYLGFDGKCEKAFKFYEQVLGGKITFMMTWVRCPARINFPRRRANGSCMQRSASVTRS